MPVQARYSRSLLYKLILSGGWRGTPEQKAACEHEFGIKIIDDGRVFETNHFNRFSSTRDPDGEERKIMVTKKVCVG